MMTTMSFSHQLITIGVVVIGTMITRFLPFILFPENKTPPVYITYLGNVLPYATMGLLVVFCLKDAVTRVFAFPELLAIIFIIILHKWKHSTFLSIGLGTIFYMVLVQTISF
ncbi:branched-chain amino acid transporter permease [Melissococcus sp. OM08-11BH]|uniref:branched-chain amino acid transporter permease n=1 Tax=Melissococcus sp. OM08-11BH TaxID=2293110 RepID=UPI001F2995A9|nr:AzlD domain-containing protein [Melissococcus sp. OM08-11BH]